MAAYNEELGESLDRRKKEALRAEDCEADCKAVFVLERRVNGHQTELTTIKRMLAENNLKTAEVLEIIGLGRSFFRVLGWVGNTLKPLMVIGAAVTGTVVWLKTGTFK